MVGGLAGPPGRIVTSSVVEGTKGDSGEKNIKNLKIKLKKKPIIEKVFLLTHAKIEHFLDAPVERNLSGRIICSYLFMLTFYPPPRILRGRSLGSFIPQFLRVKNI